MSGLDQEGEESDMHFDEQDPLSRLAYFDRDHSSESPMEVQPSEQASESQRKNVDQVIAERIRTRRLELGWYQTDLADKLGVHRAQVGFWENAKNSVYAGDLPRLAKVLGMPPAWFLGDYADEYDMLSKTIQTMNRDGRKAMLAYAKTYIAMSEK